MDAGIVRKEWSMNLNEAIAALERARDELGGEAPLLMADGLHVVKLPVGDGAVYVSDSPQPGEEDKAELLDLPSPQRGG
jgi:hypothetical protein